MLTCTQQYYESRVIHCKREKQTRIATYIPHVSFIDSRMKQTFFRFLYCPAEESPDYYTGKDKFSRSGKSISTAVSLITRTRTQKRDNYDVIIAKICMAMGDVSDEKLGQTIQSRII